MCQSCYSTLTGRLQTGIFSWTRKKILAFMEVVKESGVGPEGQLNKLERFSSALDYLKLSIDPHDMTRSAKINLIQSSLVGWKASLRKEKKRLNAIRLEQVSDSDISFDSIKAVVNNKNMWLKFNAVINKLKKGEEVGETLLKFSMASVMISILLWPGVVKNCTIEEFESAKLIDGMYIIKVKQHKTSVSGSAKLMFDEQMMGRLRYFKYVRPKLAQPGYH